MAAPGPPPEEDPLEEEDLRRDWAAGLPEAVLARVAEAFVARGERAWAAVLRAEGYTETAVRRRLELRAAQGRPLLAFALVCRGWRAAQRRCGGGRLLARAKSGLALSGRAELVEWAAGLGCPLETYFANLVCFAARRGQLEVLRGLLRWRRQRGPLAAGDESTVRAAALAGARHGHLEVLQLLRRECGFATTGALMEQAALGGHVKTLRWARETGCDWEESACAAAAQSGHLEALQWLRAEGCPWNARTCEEAAARGRVGVLRWAREHGCPWDAATRSLAAAELGYADAFDAFLP